MNIALYLVLWTAIGMLAGFIASSASENDTWGWFWANVCAGLLGSVGFGGAGTLMAFGQQAVLSAFSLVFAVFGAAFLLYLLSIVRRLRP